MDPQTLILFYNAIAQVIGEDNVSRHPGAGALRGPSGSTAYGDPFTTDKKHEPNGAVRPNKVEDVQEIMRLANQFGVALWTVSRGKNLGYGGSSPVVKDTVVLDLHRMDKVLEINEEYGYAIVEPGVSFFDLFNEIQRQGMNLWPSVPAIGWGSVLGNTMDRGFGYTPLGEHSQAQCGLEVVLPSGELLRTGMGAMTDSPLFALYKGGFGPSVDGLFYQSNLGMFPQTGSGICNVPENLGRKQAANPAPILNSVGVVTKLGIQITPAPESYATVEVDVPKESDLVPLVGILSDLMRRSVILNSPSIANIFRIALLSREPKVHEKLQQYMKPGSYVPYDVLEEVRAEQDWGFWRAYFSLYSAAEVYPGLLKTIQRAFAAIPGAKIKWREFPGEPGKAITASEIKEEEIPHSGIPTLAPLAIVDSRQAGGGHVDFSPIIPPSGRELYNWYLKAKQRTIDAKFDFFADFHVYPRYVVGIELVIYAAAESRAIDRLVRLLLRDTFEMGYSTYRTHVEYMDEVASHFDFDGCALNRFSTMLKDFLDPKGILSPGKSGIWPSAGTHQRSAPRI